MSLNIGKVFPVSSYNQHNRNTKVSANSPFIFNQNDSVIGPGPTRTAKDWDLFMEDFINNFGDEEFAANLQIGCDRKISTDKKINWQATGEDELTSDQIDYLRETYDLKNMDGQDYYNLIADLTNMNVIAGRDTIKQHAGVMPIGVVINSAHSNGEMADENGEFSMFTGNIYQKSLNRLDDLSYTLNLLNNSAPTGTAKEYLDFKAYFEEQSFIYNKLMSVFDKIVR